MLIITNVGMSEIFFHLYGPGPANSIFAQNSLLCVHRQMLKYHNVFSSKNGRLYFVSFNKDRLGVHIENGTVALVHHCPTTRIQALSTELLLLRVGNRYVRIPEDGTIQLTFFRKIATTFHVRPVRMVECNEGSTCLLSICTVT